MDIGSFFEKIKLGEALIIKDINGRIIKKLFAALSNQQNLSLAGLAPSVYFITLIDRNGMQETQKLVVQ